MKIAYLEFVTANVDGLCAMLAKLHDAQFGDPDAALGGAKVATMADGSLLGVRAPLRDDEAPVVRPYMRVNDIEAAIAQDFGPDVIVALPAMELPGYGKIAILIENGIEYGLWQD